MAKYFGCFKEFLLMFQDIFLNYVFDELREKLQKFQLKYDPQDH